MKTAPEGFIQETVTWTPVAQRMPDADTTVQIALDDTHGEPTWIGFHDGEIWRDVAGTRIEGVTHWADMPRGARR
jgi:hypothetical protein